MGSLTFLLCLTESESHAGSSLAPGMVTHAGQVKGEVKRKRPTGPPVRVLGTELTTLSRKEILCYGKIQPFTGKLKTKVSEKGQGIHSDEL